MRWLTNWFSNMEPFDTPFMHESDGRQITYLTVENFFQALKTDDHEIREYIASLSPFEAKRFAKSLPIKEDWKTIRISVMFTGLLWKFRKGTRWGNILISTYPMDIVEWNNWHDNYWGWCVCERCAARKERPENKLGELITEIRERLL